MSYLKNFLAVFIILFFTNSVYAGTNPEDENVEIPELKVISTAFKNGEMIPKKYSYDNENASPPLEWSGTPKETKGIAVICDDPDAPLGTWVHWVIFNIPPDVFGLSGNIPKERVFANGIVQGRNDFRKIGYDGPCPPAGTHRYYFKIYALDSILPLKSGATKNEVEDAMTGHILAEGQLIGRYAK